MSNNLSPQQFPTLYHGTGHEIGVGKKVLPNDRLGNRSDSRSGTVAYATPDEETAWSFAAWNSPSERQRVYEVTPSKDARRLDSQSDIPSDYSSPGEVIASHFKTVRQIDTMPGRQGTFPQVNWSRHAAASVSEGMLPEINHPANDDPSLSPPPLSEAPRIRTMAGMLQERKHKAHLRDWTRKRGPGRYPSGRTPQFAQGSLF